MYYNSYILLLKLFILIIYSFIKLNYSQKNIVKLKLLNLLFIILINLVLW